MSELRAALDTLAGAGGAAVLATVVRVSGSAYRRPGARLVLCPDGRRVGLISGGCLEGDVAKKAWWRTEGGPVVVRYDTGSGEADDARAFGLGCNGVVDVLLERIDPAAPPAFVATLRGWADARRTGALARVTAGGRVGDWLTLDADDACASNLADAGLADAVRAETAIALRAGTSRHATCAGAEVFIEVVAPPPAFLVCGGGPDAVPVATLAKLVGFHVTVCDRRAATRERFPTADAVLACAPADAGRSNPAAAVVMSHNYDDDREYLRALLTSPARYVGVLGPRRRTDALLAELAADGFTPPAGRLDHLYAPVGLDVGAETPEEIALAVVAEVRAALAGRGGGFLRDRRGPLHDRPPAAERRASAAAACVVGAG